MNAITQILPLSRPCNSVQVALALAAETALAAPAAALAWQLLAAKLHSQTWKA